MPFEILKKFFIKERVDMTDNLSVETTASIEESFLNIEKRVTEDERQNKQSVRISDDYIASLETQKNSLSDIHQKLLNNILNIMKNNEHANLTNDDIKIQDWKLYLCGTMFYGELFPEEQRKKWYLIDYQNIIKDWHQKAYKALIDFTTKLYDDRLVWYSMDLDDGKFKWHKNQSLKYFSELSKKNKKFFDKISTIIIWPDLTDINISIPICVDEDGNVFYLDQSNRQGLSDISANEYENRTNMYEYEFLS